MTQVSVKLVSCLEMVDPLQLEIQELQLHEFAHVMVGLVTTTVSPVFKTSAELLDTCNT